MIPEHLLNGLANATASTSSAQPQDAASILASILKVQREIAAHAPIDAKPKPDRNGNVYPESINGLKVVVSDLLPTTKQVAHMRERKWSHRKRFQKERRFDITYETKPCNDVYMMADSVVVNQRAYDILRDGLPAGPSSFSMGMRVADPMEIPQREYMFDFNIRPQSVALIRGGI